MADKVTAVVAIRKYFFTNGETAADILKQIKQLTPEDKKELAEGICKVNNWVLDGSDQK